MPTTMSRRYELSPTYGHAIILRFIAIALALSCEYADEALSFSRCCRMRARLHPVVFSCRVIAFATVTCWFYAAIARHTLRHVYIPRCATSVCYAHASVAEFVGLLMISPRSRCLSPIPYLFCRSTMTSDVTLSLVTYYY